jgi:hypothetical protein
VLCKHDAFLLLCRVSRDVILWRKPAEKEGVSHCSFALHTSATAEISITNGAIEGCDKTFTLVPYEDSEASSEVQDAFKRFPYLGGCTAFKFEDGIGSEVIAELVQMQLCVSTSDDGAISSATGVQIAGLLDSEYVFFFHSCSCNHVAMCVHDSSGAFPGVFRWEKMIKGYALQASHVTTCRFFYDGKLGDTDGSLTVWAPTAQSLELLHYTECSGGEADVHPMQRGPKGTWTVDRPAQWDQHYFLLRCPSAVSFFLYFFAAISSVPFRLIFNCNALLGMQRYVF